MKRVRRVTPIRTPLPLTTVVLIRHGSTDVVSSRLAGRSVDSGLNPQGANEVQQLSVDLRDIPFSAIYSSPRRRARETADWIAAAHQLPVITLDMLDEVDFGEWSASTFASLRERHDWRAYNARRSSALVPGGEAPSQTQARVAAVLAELHTRHRGEIVGAVTHAEIIRYAILLARGRSLDEWMTVEVPTASATVVSCDAVNVSEVPAWLPTR